MADSPVTKNHSKLSRAKRRKIRKWLAHFKQVIKEDAIATRPPLNDDKVIRKSHVSLAMGEDLFSSTLGMPENYLRKSRTTTKRALDEFASVLKKSDNGEAIGETDGALTKGGTTSDMLPSTLFDPSLTIDGDTATLPMDMANSPVAFSVFSRGGSASLLERISVFSTL